MSSLTFGVVSGAHAVEEAARSREGAATPPAWRPPAGTAPTSAWEAWRWPRRRRPPRRPRP
eukprot:8023281-Pyramimonas_sp.AAC.1